MARRKSKKQEETPLFDGAVDEGRLKALDAAITDITKRYGDGSIMRLGEAQHLAVDVIPTGSLGLDIILGVGGIPRGRITEIYGPESSGKTTLCLHVVAEAQKRGGICAFVDMEHALDPKYAERVGVNLDTLFVSQPDTGEQALEITESLVRSGALDVIVVDSVAALVPRAEIEGEMGDSHVGLQARLMSQALRKLSGAIKQSHVSVLFTNQLREKVGVMFGCFHYDSQVWVADELPGSMMPMKIGDIVTQKLDVEVISYNRETRQFEPRPIVNWFNNGEAEKFLRITTSDGKQLDCTPNHLILTAEGDYIPAGELRVGEALMAAREMVPAGIGFDAPSNKIHYVEDSTSITSIEELTDFQNMTRFDIEVEGNHCYLVDGVVVHNSPETTPGGRALKFYASVRLDIRRIQSIKQGGDNIGNRTKVKVKKNKVAAPFRECEFDIMFYENGISKVGEIIDIGVEMGVIEKRGAFFRYNDELLGQGRENAKTFLLENPAIADSIEAIIRQQFELPTIKSIGVSSNGGDGDEE